MTDLDIIIKGKKRKVAYMIETFVLSDQEDRYIRVLEEEIKVLEELSEKQKSISIHSAIEILIKWMQSNKASYSDSRTKNCTCLMCETHFFVESHKHIM